MPQPKNSPSFVGAEAVFEKNGGSLLVINFKNQIIERTR